MYGSPMSFKQQLSDGLHGKMCQKLRIHGDINQVKFIIARISFGMTGFCPQKQLNVDAVRFICDNIQSLDIVQ